MERALKDHVADKVLPWMREEARRQFGPAAPVLDLESSGGCERVLVRYSSAISGAEEDDADPAIGAYIRPEVVLEFGGRNSTEPNERHTVNSYLAALYPTVAFPSARGLEIEINRVMRDRAS